MTIVRFQNFSKILVGALLLAVSPFCWGDDPPTVNITSTQSIDYDSKKNVAVFRGDVVVTHPRFTMTSDELEVFLTPDGSGMDRAIATGYVTIRKNNSAKGEKNYYVGKSRRAIYKGSDETVTLTDWPQIQRNNGLMIAEERGTEMILNEAGQLQVNGPARTVVPPSQTSTSTDD